MQKIIPCLWFDTNAKEAVQFYTAIFNNSNIGATSYYTEVGHEIHNMEAGLPLTIRFAIEHFELLAMNGGPVFQFTPAISFMVNCETAAEVDALWAKLSDGGTAMMELGSYPFSERYGWLKDKYGVTWQLIKSRAPVSQKIVPSLMYTGSKAGKAEEAMNFYASLFPNSSIGTLARYGAENPQDEGTLMYGDCTLAGQKFAVMDSAGPHQFVFNEAISLLVECEDQAEIDRLWSALSADPAAEQCGWLKDKYGVSWQIAPKNMEDFINNPDTEKSKRAFSAMMNMKKLDIAALEAAFNGTH